MSSWELIVDGAIDGGRNMAIDAALLDEVEGSREVQTIVRFYGWRRPTISLGRNQKIENAVDAEWRVEASLNEVNRVQQLADSLEGVILALQWYEK